MSHRSPLSPSHTKGFIPLGDDAYNMQNNDIPLTQVRTNASSTGMRQNKGDGADEMDFAEQQNFPPVGEKPDVSGLAGRRKLKKINSKSRTNSEGEESVNAMGRIYKKIVNFSVITRYMVFVVPVGLVLAVPIVIGATVNKEDKIGGVRVLWFFTWIEAVWLGLWAAKVIAKFIPTVFMFLCGVVSSGTRKYALVIRNLEIPISLVLWAGGCLATFSGLIRAPGNDSDEQQWVGIVRNILAATLIASAIYLGEKLIIQMISISYQQRSFNGRIKDSKHNVFLLGLLYDASRSLFPMYSAEFAEEDYLINDSIEALLASRIRPKMAGRSGSQTPMRLIGDIGRFGDKITSAFGNIASEISGKQVFNPTSAHSIVVEALEKKKSSEALARRIWLSFVVEGNDALMLDDLHEVLGPGHRDEADEAFGTLDGDGNGDISLDEMILKVVEIGRERKAITSSMKDIGQAISVLDSVLVAIVFVMVVFIYVALLNANFVTTLATAGTTLLSLSFVFAVTAQEFLGSCIFLFIKHPFDVGDRVDIVGPNVEHLIVDQISLLYTIFKRIDCMKMVQVPNIVLNSLWVENVTRSRAMKELLEMSISFDTSLEDIEALRAEMEAFVRHSDNSRDFQNELVVECTGVGNMDKLVLKVEIRHKSNWSNETVRASRRSKFMCALVLALRKVPIYGPGGGGVALGDPGNPSYSVSVPDSVAAEGRAKAAAAKAALRHDVKGKAHKHSATAEHSGKSSAVDAGVLGTVAEAQAATALNARRPSADAGRDSWEGGNESSETLGRANSQEGHRGNDIEDLRQGLLKRENTRGRRRPGEAMPPLATGLSGPGFTVTPSSPSQQRAANFDEEANLGMDDRMYNVPVDDSQYPGTNPAAAGGSYSMFPPSGRPNNQGSQHQQQQVPPAEQTIRLRELNSNHGRQQ